MGKKKKNKKVQIFLHQHPKIMIPCVYCDAAFVYLTRYEKNHENQIEKYNLKCDECNKEQEFSQRLGSHEIL